MQQLHQPGQAMVARASYVKGASPRFAVSFGIRHIPYRCWHAKSTLLEHPRTFRWDTHTTAAVAAAASQSLHHAILDAESVPSFQDLFGSQGSVHHSSSGKVKVHVSIVQHVQYGQFLRLVGSAKQLGKWEAGYGPDLKWSEGDKWSIDVALAVGTYDFKFVLVHRSGHVEWEPGSNRILEVAPTAAELQVAGRWGETQDTEVLELRRQQHRQEGDDLLDDAGTMTVRAKEASAAAEAAETLKSALKQQRASRKSSKGIREFDPVIDSAAAAAAARAAATEQQQEIQQLEQAVAAAAADIKLLEALSAAEAEAAAAALAAISADDALTDQAGTGAGPDSLTSTRSRQRVEDLTNRQQAIEQGLAAAVAAASVSADGAVSAMSSQDHQQLMDMLAGLRQDMTDNMQEVASTMQDVQSELVQMQQQVEVLQAEKASLKQAAKPPVAAAKGTVTSSPAIKQQLTARLGQLSASVNNVKGAFQAAANEQTWDGSPAGASLSNSSSSSTQQNGTNGSTMADDSIAASPINVMGDAAALSGLHSAVLSWRQELLTFRQDSLELREEIDGVKDVLELVEQQLTSSTAAVTHSLQHVEQQLQANTEAVQGVGQVVRDVGDDVSQTLLQRLDELQHELRAEVQSMAGILQAAQASAAGASPGQQAAAGAVRRAAAAAAAACDEDAAAAVVGLLQSSSVAQYYKGLVYCVMMAAGLWSPGLQEDIKGQPMKLTWQAYLDRWGDASISSWRQQLNRQQQVVQASALGGLNSSTRPLPLHMLWSIRELSRHSKEVLHLLQAVCSAEDADVMHHLRPSTDTAACATVIRRWMQAANQAAAAAAAPAK